MTESCCRGNWTFVLGDGDRFVARRDYLGIGPAGYAARFWANAADGRVQVFRNPLTYKEICRFIYFGGTFEIAYDVLGVANLNAMTPEEKINLSEAKPRGDFEVCCQIIAQKSASWIEKISQEQFERFMSDIQDPELYRCLTECVPTAGPPDQSWGYGSEKPSRFFDPLSIPLGGELGFSFIADWLAGSDDIRESLTLQKPV